VDEVGYSAIFETFVPTPQRTIKEHLFASDVSRKRNK
jgi:hypothetical protein